jgi:hypothetical protein
MIAMGNTISPTNIKSRKLQWKTKQTKILNYAYRMYEGNYHPTQI